MELSQLFVVVMKNVREFVQPALDATSKRMDDSMALLRAEFAEKIAQIPAGKDGAPGVDGRPGEPGDRGEPGQAGEKGDAGAAGERGQQGEKGNDGTPGADGQPGTKGDAGEKGDRGEPGSAGERGMDGKSITIEDVIPVLESMQTKWALDFERRAQELFQRAIERMPVAKDGADGKDGRDGFGFEDLTLERKDLRHYVLRFTRGDQAKEFDIDLPMLVYRGVYKRDEDYSVGDLCSWGGHMYHRDEPQGERRTDPDKTASGWTQCVKRGNDGSSAYASAVKHGFSGSEKDWVESIGKPQVARTVKVT